MGTNINLKQKTSVQINPVMHTFLEALPLNRIEFNEKLLNEVDSNPMLEIEETSPDNKENDENISQLEKKMRETDDSMLTKYEEAGSFVRSSSKMDKNTAIELFATNENTLEDNLMKQAESEFNAKELELAQNIIYNLNKNGYLDIELESVLTIMETDSNTLENIRKKILTFSPQGCGAKNLEECLLAQIPPEEVLLRKLIENHLKDLSKNKHYDIMNALQINSEELQVLLNKIRRLNPKPGSVFEKDLTALAEVDLMLIKVNDEYKVKFIDEGLPKLKLSEYYDNMLKKVEDKETAVYLKENHKRATAFVEGIELRKNIIVKIAEYLVKVQKDFLNFGEEWKKPITMKEVAQELSLNESTISRAVNSKFVAYEKGVLSLRSFFSHGIKGEFGINISVETIKNKIKVFIDKEDKAKPLSDEAIAKKFSSLGIKISRRTIRNYRDELKLPSSSQRKQLYKVGLK